MGDRVCGIGLEWGQQHAPADRQHARKRGRYVDSSFTFVTIIRLIIGSGVMYLPDVHSGVLESNTGSDSVGAPTQHRSRTRSSPVAGHQDQLLNGWLVYRRILPFRGPLAVKGGVKSLTRALAQRLTAQLFQRFVSNYT